MAKIAKDKAATPAPAAISIANLPADLMTLVNQTAESLKLVAAGVVALETSEGAEKATVTDNLAAVTAQVEQLHAAIDAWFDSYVRARLAAADERCEAELENRNRDLTLKLKAADDEATRQLEEKRAVLERQLQSPPAGVPWAPPPVADLVTVTVIGPPKGLRRAGFVFAAEPKTVAVTPEQLKQIQADPSLAVSLGGSAVLAERAEMIARLAVDAFEFGESETVDVTVLGPTKGRRRAGFAFSDAAQTVSVTREQLALLLEDEELAVQPA